MVRRRMIFVADAPTSRSTLHERFVHLIGRPPLKYLWKRRTRVAARLLRDTNSKRIEGALGVGYEGEAAFSRPACVVEQLRCRVRSGSKRCRIPIAVSLIYARHPEGSFFDVPRWRSFAAARGKSLGSDVTPEWRPWIR